MACIGQDPIILMACGNLRNYISPRKYLVNFWLILKIPFCIFYLEYFQALKIAGFLLS